MEQKRKQKLRASVHRSVYYRSVYGMPAAKVAVVSLLLLLRSEGRRESGKREEGGRWRGKRLWARGISSRQPVKVYIGMRLTDVGGEKEGEGEEKMTVPMYFVVTVPPQSRIR
jgi:hypothetical protein